jgi:hypothetical protein
MEKEINEQRFKKLVTYRVKKWSTIMDEVGQEVVINEYCICDLIHKYTLENTE